MDTLDFPTFPPFPNPPDGFKTVMADPPWKYDDKLEGEDVTGAAEDHYETLSTAQIMGLGEWVREVTAPSAHLYLWTTGSHLSDAFAVIDAWGFDYKQTLTWLKTYDEPAGLPHERTYPARYDGVLGMGQYYRNSTEFLLFATKGNRAVNRSDVATYFMAEPTGHSYKPDKAYRLAEIQSDGPRFEMFARSGRQGWVTWGDEAPDEDDLTATPPGVATVADPMDW